CAFDGRCYGGPRLRGRGLRGALLRLRRGDLRRGGLGLLLRGLQSGLDVALDDASAGAAPVEAVEVDARLGGHARGDGRDEESAPLRAPPVARRLRARLRLSRGGLRLSCGRSCGFPCALRARPPPGRLAAADALA